MMLSDLEKKYNQIKDNLLKGNLKHVFEHLKALTEQTQNRDFSMEVENNLFTYQSMLKFTFELADDPEREKVYNSLIKNLFGILDQTKEQIITQNHLKSIYNKKSASTLTQQFGVDHHKLILELLEGYFTEGVSHSDDKEVLGHFDKLFNHYWLNNAISDTEFSLFNAIQASQVIPWQYKTLMISAISLSVFRFFDTHKIHLLFNCLETDNQQIWVRAFVGIVFIYLLYDNRLKFYPKITNRFKSVADVQFNAADFDMVIIQFVKSQDTPRITKKIQEEIMPDMIKMQSKLTDKLDLENITSLEEMHEKNPEWQSVFEESPDLYDKVERISKMQTEGIDIFHSAFSMLKHFPFFNSGSNWFLPFYKENYELQRILLASESSQNEKMMDQLEGSTLMCNSDKYSFCFNINMLPDVHKSQLLTLFDMELSAMNELEEDEKLINTKAYRKNIVKQYMQDLYRFFKVYPERNQLMDIFDTIIDFEDTFVVDVVDPKREVIKNIGEYFFENENFEIAIKYFDYNCNFNDSFEHLEKIGFAYQKIKNYTKALDYYKKSELVNKNNQWLTKKIALCYKELGEFEKALGYFKDAEQKEKDNLYLLASIANVHMEMSNYEEALQLYFKIEYLSPNSIVIMRPLAYCSLQLGKLDNVKNYLLKIADKERNEYDYLYLGITEWTLKKPSNAINYFVLALQKVKGDISFIINELATESDLLNSYGISKLEKSLMVDYLAFNT